MRLAKNVWTYFLGKKTFIVALSAVVYGWYAGDKDAVLLGLGLFGLRSGLKTEVANVLDAVKRKK